MNQVILRIHLCGTTADIITNMNTAKQHITRWGLGQLGERFGDATCYAPWEVRTLEITGMQILIPPEMQQQENHLGTGGRPPFWQGSGLN